MPEQGWSQPESPFHRGEQAIQERLGVRAKLERQGRRAIRDHLPDQHRDFLTQLPFLVLGTVDPAGRPWASIVAGQPGFLSSPDPITMRVGAAPITGDPLADNLRPGADIGVLALEFASRRRNRMNGKVAANDAHGFAIRVGQSFGNCPQYIQSRSFELAPIDRAEPPPRRQAARLGPTERVLIEAADTFFIATRFAEVGDQATHGADVSHRGGKPGFVRIDDDHALTWPEFVGNFHFNTLGNLALNPKAALLFVDFASGDLLQLTGTAEIVWDGPEVEAFAGAERLVRFRLDELIHLDGGLPIRWTCHDPSPALARTGSWRQTADVLAAERSRDQDRTFKVARVEPESALITSFYLEPEDGHALASYQPGQFLPVRLDIPGETAPVIRTYTLSDAPDGRHYRLSIKREPSGIASTHFHDRMAPGATLKAKAPRGKFVLDQASARPAVLLSAGVGITPMIAMLNHIVAEGERTRDFRPVWFVHGARNGHEHGFGAHVRHLAATHDLVHAHIRYSAPTGDDQIGTSHDSEGHVDVALLKSVLPFDDYDFYLCGPSDFMQSLYRGLRRLGIAPARIHYEFFGPATVLQDEPAAPAAAPEPSGPPVPVTFARSGIDASWEPSEGSLLELAEQAGLAPAYSCRSGICGSCAVDLVAGQVDYREQPVAETDAGQILLCCAIPAGDAEDRAVVVDL